MRDESYECTVRVPCTVLMWWGGPSTGHEWHASIGGRSVPVVVQPMKKASTNRSASRILEVESSDRTHK